ncbi:MAG: glycosyltransferase [Pseudonocardiaceae bacterium]|nr:glycosyltransferase [Pseudonocardiaceae bacterium]
MRRTLLVSNDFPPRPGGIQAYLHELARRLPADRLAVYAPDWPGSAGFDARLPFPVYRHPGRLMLPGPDVGRRAARIAREHGCEVVWFGAAAPLALLATRLRRAGVARVVASTHGHEVGWSMVPVARRALRRIGHDTDLVTAVSRYTRRRISAAFGPQAVLEPLPPGVDAAEFRPDAAARDELRRRYGLGGAPVVVCVSRLVPRKGQDVLVRALPQIRRSVPGAVLLLVGGGPYRDALRRLAARCGVAGAVVHAGAVAWRDLPAHYAAGDVFAMPCRTRGGGLDVEGLGIVFLEAAATGLPVVAGDSGGAPETVRAGRTGFVVDGREVAAVARGVAALLADPDRAALMGAAGRAWMQQDWDWARRAERMAGWLDGP